jgi:hypothetical protein
MLSLCRWHVSPGLSLGPTSPQPDSTADSSPRSVILFDGALPDSKHAERLSRTEQNNRRVRQLRTSYPTTACPRPSYLGASAYAFLAPSLREALNASSFASRTHIVPGEADDFCALHARDTARSIIFSSDTDLLLYDYRPETLIVFVHEAEPSAGLKAYVPHQIQDALQVKSLVALAYVIQQKSSEGLGDLVLDALRIDVDSASYLEFSTRYTTFVVTPMHPTKHVNLLRPLQDLDVRVSEFAHQALGDSLRPIVYLPLLVEDPNLASAWNIAQQIRTLAYALLAAPNSIVQEYRRKAQGISSHDLSLYSATDVAIISEQVEGQVAALLNWAASKDISPALLWSLFAVNLVLTELNTPPSPLLVARVLNGDFDDTWPFIQLSARLQAGMYSLRLLKQVVAVRRALGQLKEPKLDKSLTSLHIGLSSFPSIPDVFVVPGQTRRVLAEHESMRRLVEEMYTAAGITIPDQQISNKKKKRQAREADIQKRKLGRGSRQNAQVSNAFALLDEWST